MVGIGVIICILWFIYVINMYYEGYTDIKNNKDAQITNNAALLFFTLCLSLLTNLVISVLNHTLQA